MTHILATASMPTYEYVCTACDNHWEEVQKISADALEVCPKCGKSTAKRQISGGNFILKGGGWYADAYSSQPKAKAGEGKSEKSEGKSEGASAAAAPAKGEGAGPSASPSASSGSGGSSGSSGSGGSSGSSGSGGSSAGS